MASDEEPDVQEQGNPPAPASARSAPPLGERHEEPDADGGVDWATFDWDTLEPAAIPEDGAEVGAIGSAMDLLRFAKAFSDGDARRVAEDASVAFGERFADAAAADDEVVPLARAEDREMFGTLLRVSTVDLMLAQSGGRFETLVSWSGGWRVVGRYRSRDAAAEGHERVVAALRAGRAFPR